MRKAATKTTHDQPLSMEDILRPDGISIDWGIQPLTRDYESCLNTRAGITSAVNEEESKARNSTKKSGIGT